MNSACQSAKFQSIMKASATWLTEPYFICQVSTKEVHIKSIKLENKMLWAWYTRPHRAVQIQRMN